MPCKCCFYLQLSCYRWMSDLLTQSPINDTQKAKDTLHCNYSLLPEQSLVSWKELYCCSTRDTLFVLASHTLLPHHYQQLVSKWCTAGTVSRLHEESLIDSVIMCKQQQNNGSQHGHSCKGRT